MTPPTPPYLGITENFQGAVTKGFSKAVCHVKEHFSQTGALDAHFPPTTTLLARGPHAAPLALQASALALRAGPPGSPLRGRARVNVFFSLTARGPGSGARTRRLAATAGCPTANHQRLTARQARATR